jgi:hypothetical protein
VKDELEKMNLEGGYLNEDIKAFDWECEELAAQTKVLIDLNIKLKEEEANAHIKHLQDLIKDIDSRYQRAQILNDEYQKLIKDGLRVNNEDV